MKTRRDFVLDGARGLAALGAASMATAMSEEKQSKTGLVYDDIYLTHVIRPDHVESPLRLRRIPNTR